MASDSQNKYQKLAQEYQKTRSQVVVLKKAVIDEQTTVKEQQENIKQKDQLIRKFEQEIDSLQFRNEQLSRRVGVLQADLDDADRKGGTRKVSSEARSTSNDVAQQELGIKIQENESLHKQLHAANEEHAVAVNDLQENLMHLQSQASAHSKVVADTTSKYEHILDRQQEERAILEAKLQRCQEDLKIANIMADKYHKQLKGVHTDVKAKLDCAVRVMAEKLPFNDTETTKWNVMNVPVCDRNHQVQAQKCVKVFSSNFEEMMLSLSDFFTYYEQRLKLFHSDIQHSPLSTINSKLSIYLLDNAAVLRKSVHAAKCLEERTDANATMSLDNCAGLADFSSSLSTSVKYMEKLLPYFKLSCGEECTLMSTSEAVEQVTMHFHCCLTSVVTSLQRISSAVEVISHKDIARYTAAAKLPCFLLLSKAVKRLQTSCQGMEEQFVEKSNLEKSLPSMTEHLHNTNQCVIGSLGTFRKSSKKLEEFLQENINFLMQQSGIKRRGILDPESQAFSQSNILFQTKAVDYIKELNMSPTPSVPYATALQNHRVITSSTASRDSLAQQVVVAQESISKLEQEKEHWVLESQLIKAKLENEVKRVVQLQDELCLLRSEHEDQLNSPSGLSKAQDSVGVAVTPQQHSGSGSLPKTTEAKSKVGFVEYVDKDKELVDDHDRLIKEHFSSRITELTKQLQKTDSKAVTFHGECRALYKQLVLADRNMKKCEHELTISHQKVEKLQDELETTKRSYEDQLQMLSDHLCGMNEKLTVQRDEIDMLKSSTKSKSNKKKT